MPDGKSFNFAPKPGKDHYLPSGGVKVCDSHPGYTILLP